MIGQLLNQVISTTTCNNHDNQIVCTFTDGLRVFFFPQSYGHDRLRQPVRPGLHGDAEHAEVRQSRPKHQEQGDGEPRQDEPTDQRPARRDSPTSDGADGVQGGERWGGWDEPRGRAVGCSCVLVM